MTISLTKEQAQELREDPKAFYTETCPLCDPTISVQGGISLPHICRKCNNVWQPRQILAFGSPFSSCISKVGEKNDVMQWAYEWLEKELERND